MALGSKCNRAGGIYDVVTFHRLRDGRSVQNAFSMSFPLLSMSKVLASTLYHDMCQISDSANRRF